MLYDTCITIIYSTIQINHCLSHYYDSTHSQSDIYENEQFLCATNSK